MLEIKLNYSIPLNMNMKGSFSSTTQAAFTTMDLSLLCYIFEASLFGINNRYLVYYLQWPSHSYPVDIVE